MFFYNQLVGWWHLMAQRPGMANDHQTQSKRIEIKSTTQNMHKAQKEEEG